MKPRPLALFPAAVFSRRWLLLPAVFLMACAPMAAAEDKPAAAAPAPVSTPAKEAEPPDFRQKGAAHLAEILRQPWAQGWAGATLEEVRLVPPKPGAAFPTRLPAAWHARIAGPEGKFGYLMWEDRDQGGLIEFAFDDRLAVEGPDGKALSGVTALQQFPLPGEGENAKPVASGCVPTAGASVFDFWRRRLSPSSAEAKDHEEQTRLRDLTRQLRSRISMMTIPDRDGFTGDSMDLAGANPEELAKALQAEAEARQLKAKVRFDRFSFEALKSEINAGRPALLSCVVRVPHKPELSWGHEVAATGWLELGGTRFAGILDNFYPVRHPETVRWIREDAFVSLIIMKPAD
ncbi:MAG: hypothetical protein EOP86_07885 [Verrucomicrobiaceae bacterium]|nr:MAG: hypothetical protein EOP86_07885 [Verrucomicrobiaceae bacterium]